MKRFVAPAAAPDVSLTTVPLFEGNPSHRAALSARACRTALRVAVAEAKGREAQAQARADADRRIEQSCEKAVRRREENAEMRRQNEARVEDAKQAKVEKQAAKLAEAAAKKQKKSDEKKHKAQLIADRKVERARDKTRKQYLGGMAWGYDPKAGVSDCSPADTESSRFRAGLRNSESQGMSVADTASSAGNGLQFYDRVTGRYYRKSEFDSVWGIEVGGPNRRTPPCYHRDRFAQAMAAADKTSRVDRGGVSGDPDTSQGVLYDAKVKKQD